MDVSKAVILLAANPDPREASRGPRGHRLRMSNQWRAEEARCQREIERHRNADKSYLDEGVALLELARNAQRLFAKQELRERAPLAEPRAIELHLGGWRSGRDLPATV